MTMIFDLIMFLIIGLAAGAIASFYMGRQQELVPNLLIGIAGAFIGGWIFREAGWQAPWSGLPGVIFVAFIGSVVLLAIVHLVSGGFRRRAAEW